MRGLTNITLNPLMSAYKPTLLKAASMQLSIARSTTKEIVGDYKTYEVLIS
jgi:hypothetical protein